uniref:Uncharacterized protein n=1 Tax=Arundo donax TaxID=35708 RepID=A0A0A9FQ00_ARUDO
MAISCSLKIENIAGFVSTETVKYGAQTVPKLYCSCSQ